jgi:mono/diheme cytochrome c family protein
MTVSVLASKTGSFVQIVRSRARVFFAASLAVGIALICGCSTAAGKPAASAAPPAASPTLQSSLVRGKTIYEAQCASCHAPNLDGGMGPKLIGESFMSNWSGRSLAQLSDQILNTMPATAPGSLSEEEAADLAIYIIARNGSPLPTSAGAETLSQHVIQKAAK